MAEAGPPPNPKLPPGQVTNRLDSWKEIAAYLKLEIRTVQRWEKTMSLPVRRLGDQQGVFAYQHEIDAWWRERESKLNADVELAPAPNPARAELDPFDKGRKEVEPPYKGTHKAFSRRSRTILVAALCLIVIVISVRFLWPTLQSRFSSRPKQITLGILPFKNLSGDPEAQHIAEALTEETISELGRLHPQLLRVVGLPPNDTSPRSFTALGKTDYVLQGTVQRAGPRMAVTAQLVLDKDQSRVWGDRYQRDLLNPEDIIPMEIEIADSLSNRVLAQLPRGDRPSSRVSRMAYEDYLEGRFFWERRTSDSLKKSIAYFEKAVQEDPGYAPAYAGLADAYSLLGSAPYTALTPTVAWPKAEAAARRALELDDSLAEAHVSLGYTELVYHRNYPKAEKEFQEAIRLRPAYPTAHQYYGYYLTAMGRLNEAIAERQTARELDPLSPLLKSALGEAFYQSRQFDNTIEQNQKSLELDPTNAIALVNLGRAYEQKGELNSALAAFSKIQVGAPDDPAVLALIGHAQAIAGHRADALQIVAKLQRMKSERYIPALYFALIYTGLNDREDAFAWLDKAYDEHCEYLVYLPSEPMADPLRRDQRFKKLLDRLGLNAPVTTTSRQ